MNLWTFKTNNKRKIEMSRTNLLRALIWRVTVKKVKNSAEMLNS